jgi:hypothetical protein
MLLKNAVPMLKEVASVLTTNTFLPVIHLAANENMT